MKMDFNFMASVAVGVITMTAVALAQNTPPAPKINIINCANLKGKPLVCIVNENDLQVTDVDCQTSGFFGGKKSKGISVPRGGIPPHSMTVVDAEGCKGTVVFTMLGGQERQVPNVDTNNAVRIDVPSH